MRKNKEGAWRVGEIFLARESKNVCMKSILVREALDMKKVKAVPLPSLTGGGVKGGAVGHWKVCAVGGRSATHAPL